MALPPPPPPPAGLPANGPIGTLAHCYRHPNREAGRSCTRCGKSACSECLVRASVGSHCIDCTKAARPDIKTRARYWNAGQPALLTIILIGINLAVFAFVTLSDASSLGGRRGITLRQFELGLNVAFLQDGRNEWYRLVTSGFLHFGIIHIALNMWLLYQLGNLLERPLGRLRFGMLYGAALLGGSFGVLIENSGGIAGGASGAVFGLMAAAAVSMHRQGISIWRTGIGTTLLLNVVLTFTIPGISKGGHVGGAVAGAICGFIMLAPRWKAFPKWAAYATPAAVAAVSLIGSYVIATTGG